MLFKTIFRRLLTGPAAIKDAASAKNKAQKYENICLYFCLPAIAILSLINLYIQMEKRKEPKPERIPYEYLQRRT